MKTSSEISFRHNYHKLNQDVFTTIRGKAQFQRRKVGERLSIITPQKTFQAEIKALELRRIVDMPLDFLKADAEYPGCTITEKSQFVNLLNSFRAPMWTQVTPESELTIITLQKLYDQIKS